MVMIDALKITKGELKPYSKIADSGNTIINYFCSNCGSTLYRISTGFPGVAMIRAGCIDNLDIAKAKPTVELWTRSHVGWVPFVQETEKIDGGIYTGLVSIYSGEGKEGEKENHVPSTLLTD
ncbi:hypothetical protein CLAIMM_03524 [Cladophialophora immunda]|nr:hypothetical protein CLAIMM_03524 [Cladophialophora immunda]